MAIFGDLGDLPFPDLFNVVDQRSGRLLIFGIPGQGRFELDLVGGSLRGLQIDGQDIDDPLHVRDRLAVLMRAPNGLFAFHRSRPEQLRDTLDLPISWLVMALASALDEIGAYRERFPHPRTRFEQLVSAEVSLDPNLRQFAERAMPYLRRGTDAEELACALGVSLEQVQLLLYKLRAVGLVGPVCDLEDDTLAMPVPPGCFEAA